MRHKITVQPPRTPTQKRDYNSFTRTKAKTSTMRNTQKFSKMMKVPFNIEPIQNHDQSVAPNN